MSLVVPLVEPEINNPLMEQSYNTIISLPILTVKITESVFFDNTKYLLINTIQVSCIVRQPLWGGGTRYLA